jgi:hypothetical protein
MSRTSVCDNFSLPTTSMVNKKTAIKNSKRRTSQRAPSNLTTKNFSRGPGGASLLPTIKLKPLSKLRKLPLNSDLDVADSQITSLPVESDDSV